MASHRNHMTPFELLKDYQYYHNFNCNHPNQVNRIRENMKASWNFFCMKVGATGYEHNLDLYVQRKIEGRL